MAKIFLKKNEERRLLAGHQWIFSNEIEKIEELENNGEVSGLYTHNNKFLGLGFYNRNSLIAYRHLTGKDEEIGKAFLYRRIGIANALRKRLTDGNVYRMVNSESDLLPGLIIDRFENNYSIQIFSLGMDKYLDIIKDILVENFRAELIVEKDNNELRVMEGLEKIERIIYPQQESHDISADHSFIAAIDDLKYKIDLLAGQKTGFYLDQAHNRKGIRKYIKDESKVLDLFCNEGGFALNAAYAGAKDITLVDVSEHSVNIAKQNAELNIFPDMKFIVKDVFNFFDDIFQSPDRYDIIILDPPSFTKSKKNVYTAAKGYQELNYKAMRLLVKGGFLFTYSCSHHISEEMFEDILKKSSVDSKRKIQMIEKSVCSFDHPVLPAMPETKYLKGYVLRVM
ncbi:class I SAM-dependent rRNA methyltransferase [soil metagenome]